MARIIRAVAGRESSLKQRVASWLHYVYSCIPVRRLGGENSNMMSCDLNAGGGPFPCNHGTNVAFICVAFNYV